MKSFIVAALLVAAVAGGSLDMLKLNKEKSMLKYDRPLVNELLLKKLGYPLEKTLIYGDNTELPLYLQDEILEKKVLTLEEITVSPLFREYMSLPLFRQYWSYPMFQRFVSSVYFQRFWHIPAFKQYFVNPILFQKYIFPLVNLFKTDLITSDITSTSVLDDIVKGDLFKGDLTMNKNLFPFVSGYEQEILKQKLNFPTIYNKDVQVYDDIYSKTLLEKLYNQLLVNKPIIDDEIFGKIVDPINVGIKTIDDEIIPVEYIKTIYGEKLVKDVLIKKLVKLNLITPEIYEAILLGKVDLLAVLLKENIITPQVYQLIVLGKIDRFTVFRHILRQETLKTVVVEDLYKEVILKKLVKYNIIAPEVYEAVLLGKIDLVTVLLKEKIITPEIYQLVVLGKVDLFTILNKILGEETYTTNFLPKHILKEILLKKLLKLNIITPEIYEAVLVGKIDFLTVLLKKNIITPEVYQYVLLGKFDQVTLFRHILRLDVLKTIQVQDLIYNTEMIPTTYKFNPFETVYQQKFDTLDNMNVFDIKKTLVNDDILPFYLKKDLFNDKIFNDKIFTDKVNELELTKYDTVVPKMVDIHTPTMGVKTFDKKMEVIKA